MHETTDRLHELVRNAERDLGIMPKPDTRFGYRLDTILRSTKHGGLEPAQYQQIWMLRRNLTNDDTKV
jgi:hypothetical protein